MKGDCPSLDGINKFYNIFWTTKKYCPANKSIRFSALEFWVVPAYKKNSEIIPLFRKRKKSKPENNRPISECNYSFVCKTKTL